LKNLTMDGSKPSTANYRRGQSPTAIAANAFFADPETATFGGAVLNITIGAGFAAGDQITFLSGNGVSRVGSRILFNNTTIGLISRTARTVQIAFNYNASAAAIGATIRATAFNSTSATTPLGDRNLRFEFFAGEGGFKAALVRVSVIT